MINFIKQLLFSIVTALCVVAQVNFAFSQQAGLLFVAPQQFFDNNGNPLSSGKVYYYIPNTLTFKTVWGDAAETTPLTNPVTLDAAGRPNGAVAIYGQGTYRQIIRKANNDLIADLVTSSGGGGSGAGGATGDGDLVGTIKPWAGLIAPNQYAFAYGQELSRTTYATLLTAIIQIQTVTCTTGSPILTNVTDTTQIRVGSAIELTCVAPGTTVLSKTALTITLSGNSSLSTNTTATFFPFGNGNGSTTFNLPDLRGYTIAGRNNMGGTASARLTTAFFNPGGTSNPDALGAPGGAQSHTMSLAELVAHNHGGVTGNESAAHTHGPGTLGGTTGNNNANHTHDFTAVLGVSATTGTAGAPHAFPNAGTVGTTAGESASHQHAFSVTTGISANNSGNHTHTIPSAGSTSAFSVIQPSLTLNYIIKITPDTASSVSTGVTSIQSMVGDIACGVGLTCTGNIISATGGGGGAGTPADPITSVQINAGGGLFGGSANLVWVSPKLSIGAVGTTGQLAINGSGSGSVIQTVQAAAGTPTITWGTSTGTPVVTASAPLSIVAATGNIVVTGAAGQILAGATPAFTATPTLGASGTLGSLTFGNATSGLLTLSPVAGALGTVTLSMPAATDTLVGKATTDIFTNKTFDTAGTGNSLLINGLAVTANTGTGSVVRATSPTLVTPTLGVATATTINKVIITQPATGSTITVADGKTFTASNTIAFTGTDGTSFAFPSTSSTVATTDAIQTLTFKTLTAPVINGGTHVGITSLGIRSTGTGAFDLTLNNTGNLTAGRTLTLLVNNADRTLNLSGNLTTAAAFTTAGSSALTLTTTGTTNVTLPISGTLAAIDISQTFSGTNVFSALTQFTDLKLSSGRIYPLSDGSTALRINKADGTTRIMNFDTTNARVGINKDAGVFDLDVNGAVNVGGVLTFGTLSATSLGASTSTITGLTINNTPNASNDYFLYYSNADGAIRRCTVGSCTAAGVAGVSSLNGLTGALSIAQGPGTIVASGGTTITLSASNVTPQGRLTLVSDTPVMTTSQTAATTVYYTSSEGRIVPVYDGTNMTMQTICPVNTAGACELSVALGSNWTTASIYDFFIGVDAGTVRLCTGLVWSSSTARAAGGAIQRINGLYSNQSSMTCRYNNTTTFTCGVNQCTYVGTMLTGAAGQTNYIFGSLASGGGAATFGIWNAYNRKNVATSLGDTTATWTYATAAWRGANNSATIRVNYVAGLAEEPIKAVYTTVASHSAGGVAAVGIGLDAVNAYTGVSVFNSTTTNATVVARYDGIPGIGSHFVSAIEYTNTATATYGGAVAGLIQTGLSFAGSM